MDRKVIHGKEAREGLIAGARVLYNAVSSTLGPKGRNVVIERIHGLPHVTKDGVTVAKVIQLSDEVENMGAKLLQQASVKTGEVAGDGTTTSTVLAMELLEEGNRRVMKGEDPMRLVREWEGSLGIIDQRLAELSEPLATNSLFRVCTIAANGRAEIGAITTNVLQKVGVNGKVMIESSPEGVTEFKEIPGSVFPFGLASSYFVTNIPKMEAEVSNPLVIATDYPLWHVNDMKPLLEMLTRDGSTRPFVIFAPQIDKEALAVLVANHLRGAISCIAIQTPSFGEQNDFLEDICLLTGATLISSKIGLNIRTPDESMFGRCGRVLSNKDETTILQGEGSRLEVDKRIEYLNKTIAAEKDENRKGYFETRKGILLGKAAAIFLGAYTKGELREKIDLTDDSLCAGRSALKEGIVAGGGATYYELSKLTNIHPILRKALVAPIKKLLSNAGIRSWDITRILQHLKPGHVYDPTDNTYTGGLNIPDPTLVVRTAIHNAVSVASTILTTNCAIGFDEVATGKVEAMLNEGGE